MDSKTVSIIKKLQEINDDLEFEFFSRPLDQWHQLEAGMYEPSHDLNVEPLQFEVDGGQDNGWVL